MTCVNRNFLRFFLLLKKLFWFFLLSFFCPSPVHGTYFARTRKTISFMYTTARAAVPSSSLKLDPTGRSSSSTGCCCCYCARYTLEKRERGKKCRKPSREKNHCIAVLCYYSPFAFPAQRREKHIIKMAIFEVGSSAINSLSVVRDHTKRLLLLLVGVFETVWWWSECLAGNKQIYLYIYMGFWWRERVFHRAWVVMISSPPLVGNACVSIIFLMLPSSRKKKKMWRPPFDWISLFDWILFSFGPGKKERKKWNCCCIIICSGISLWSHFFFGSREMIQRWWNTRGLVLINCTCPGVSKEEEDEHVFSQQGREFVIIRTDKTRSAGGKLNHHHYQGETAIVCVLLQIYIRLTRLFFFLVLSLLLFLLSFGVSERGSQVLIRWRSRFYSYLMKTCLVFIPSFFFSFVNLLTEPLKLIRIRTGEKKI